MAEKAITYFERSLRNKALSTQDSYKRDLKRFLEYYELTHEEIYNKKRAIKAGILSGEIDPREGEEIENMVIDYLKHLEDQGYKPNTRRGIVKALKFFFVANKLMDERESLISKDASPSAQAEGKRTASPDQINAILGACHGEYELRNRALVHALIDTGLRPSDLELITVEKWEGASIPEEGFRDLGALETKKKGIYAYPHFGPDSVKAIEEYLADRRIKGIDVPELFHGDKLEHQRGKRIGFRGMDRKVMSGQIKYLRNYAKLETSISANSFRKYHATTLDASGLSGVMLARLQGKKVKADTGVFDPYLRPQETGALTKAYIEAYPNLSVLKLETSKAIDQLRGENEDLRDQLEATIEMTESGLSELSKDNATLRDLLVEILSNEDIMPHLTVQALEALKPLHEKQGRRRY